MKTSPKFLIYMLSFLGMAMSCTDFVGLEEDQIPTGPPDPGMVANGAESQPITSQAAINPYNFNTLIHFESDTATWKEIQKKAKKESKPVLFYGWAAWCQPCLFENSRVLRNDAALTQYLNDQFINTRFMMETIVGEHVSEAWDVLDKLKITLTAYPVFLFFDSKGKLVYKYEGTTSAADLLTMAQAASVLDNKDKIKNP